MGRIGAEMVGPETEMGLSARLVMGKSGTALFLYKCKNAFFSVEKSKIRAVAWFAHHNARLRASEDKGASGSESC